MAQAESTATYRLIAANGRGSFTGKNSTVMRLRSAIFDAANDTVTLTPRKPYSVHRPVQLTIPSIGVRTGLVHLGLTTSGTLQVPKTTSVAGWYTGSARPGAIGSAVIVGHIDSTTGPGVFYHLDQLRRGSKVYVKRADGTLAVFQVTAVRSYPKERFPTDAVYGPEPDAELRLITCGGAFDFATGHYLSNTIVYADMIQ